eukprot:m.462394 g.462394  ORF g.462394 m.462394 type:complete len:160 (+) comp22639_c0_seq1:77-556(+)
MADFVMLQRLSSKTHVGPEAVPVPPTNSHDRKTVKKDRQCIDKETTKGTADVDDEEAARSRLEIGQRVKVDGYPTEGVVRFLGNHANDGRFRVGVALDSPCGNTNGIVQGHKYFQCMPECGVLTIPSRVDPIKKSSLAKPPEMAPISTKTPLVETELEF